MDILTLGIFAGIIVWVIWRNDAKVNALFDQIQEIEKETEKLKVKDTNVQLSKLKELLGFESELVPNPFGLSWVQKLTAIEELKKHLYELARTLGYEWKVGEKAEDGWKKINKK